MPSSQDKVWYEMWKKNSVDLRNRAILWRKQNAVTRIEKPSRLLRARRIGYKAKQGIIVVPATESGEQGTDAVIPDWVRNNAKWWSEGQIDDKTFANGIEFLINVGIIVV